MEGEEASVVGETEVVVDLQIVGHSVDHGDLMVKGAVDKAPIMPYFTGLRNVCLNCV